MKIILKNRDVTDKLDDIRKRLSKRRMRFSTHKSEYDGALIERWVCPGFLWEMETDIYQRETWIRVYKWCGHGYSECKRRFIFKLNHNELQAVTV